MLQGNGGKKKAVEYVEFLNFSSIKGILSKTAIFFTNQAPPTGGDLLKKDYMYILTNLPRMSHMIIQVTAKLINEIKNV